MLVSASFAKAARRVRPDAEIRTVVGMFRVYNDEYICVNMEVYVVKHSVRSERSSPKF